MGAEIRVTWALLVLALLGRSHAFFGVEELRTNCSVLFYLDPDASLLSVSGSLESPDEDLLPGSSTTGLLGAIQLQFETNSSTCPDTPQLVLKALQDSDSKALLQSVGDLVVYPSILSLDFGEPARSVRVTDVAVGLEAEPGFSVGEGTFKVDVTAVAISGPSWVGDIQLDDETIDLEGNESTTKNTVTVKTKIEGQTLLLELTKMAADLGIASPVMDGESPDVVTGVISLTGSVSAKSVLGCSPNCGKNGHGKCGLNERSDPVCICECGWDGFDCDNPKGFCPTFSDMLVANSECTRCKSGWKGRMCNSCTRNNTCNEFWGDDNMECRTTPIFQDRTQLKVYSCDFAGTLYSEFVGPNVEIACNTSGIVYQDTPKTGALEDVIDGPWCDLSLKWLDVTPVRCIATMCEFALNSTKGHCEIASCECNGEKCTGDTGPIFGSGIKEIDLSCKEDEDDLPVCTLILGSLGGIELTAPCHTSECYDPDGPLMAGLLKEKPGDGVDWKLLLLGSPLFLHVFIAFIVGASACILHRRAFLASPSKVFGASSKGMEQSVSLSEIKLENVSCSVPKRKTLEEKKSEGGVLRKLSAIATANEDGELEGQKNPLPHLKGLTHEVIQMLQPPRKGYKSILQDVNCTFTTGELVAIMGPSGCGKSTFLSVLSGMSLFGTSQRLVTGRIMVNGKKRGSWIRKIVVYVPQEDNMMAMLTVRECLTYSAILRLPVGTKYDVIFKRVHDSIAELGLESVADNQVGGSHGIRGVSGGERRRVTIGMEMVTRPTIILMDEPTSGLDSHTALSLMTLLKRISQHGRLIVLSVHQPTPVMFSKLDKILLLAHGFPVFLGHPQEIDTFFKRHGRPVPRGTHPAEHILSVVSRPDALVAVLNSIFCPNNRVAEESGRSGVVRRAMHSVILDGELSQQLATEAKPKIPCFARAVHSIRRSMLDLKVTFWRGFVDIRRNPVLLVAHWVMSTIMGIGLGFIFFDVKRDFAGAQNRLGGFFFCLAFLAFTASTIVDVLHVERTIVLREIKAGYYRPFMYMISKMVLDSLLLRCIPAVLLGIPVYFLMGLQGEWTRFFMFIFALCTFNMTVGALSMSLAILIMNSGTASLIINIAVLVSLLFSSFPANASTVPTALSWISHVSFIGYGLRILTVNEFEGLSFKIQAADNLPEVVMDSSTILSVLGISNHLSKDICIMVGICFGSMVLVLVSIWLQTKLGIIRKLLNRIDWRGKMEEPLQAKSSNVIRRPSSYYGISLATQERDRSQAQTVDMA